MRAGRRPC